LLRNSYQYLTSYFFLWTWISQVWHDFRKRNFLLYFLWSGYTRAPKAHALKAWFSAGAIVRWLDHEDTNFHNGLNFFWAHTEWIIRRQDLWEEIGHWGAYLQRVYLVQSPFLSWPLLPGWPKVRSFPLSCSCAMMFLPCHRPNSNGEPSWPWTETSETVRQNKCFLFYGFFQSMWSQW
jgi:hypothetical protein